MVVKKRIPTSLKVDPELWQEVKIMAIRVHKNITEYFEDALRERLVKDYEIVAAERKRKEQERLHKEELDQRYQQIINSDPGVDAYNKDKDRSKTIHQLGEEPPNRLTGIDAEKIRAKASGRIVEEQLQPQQEPTNTSDYTILELPIILTLNLPGIKFPANKAKIMEYAEKANTAGIITHVVAIPNKEYKNKSELKNELINNARAIGPILEIFVKEGNFRYEIDDRELKKDQYQKRLSSQQYQLAKLHNAQRAKNMISSEQR